MQSKKGFTLIELLAAIIVLAIVLTVAVPAITGLINNSKTNAFKVDANMLLKTIESKVAGLEEYDVSIINVDNMESEIGIANDNYKSLVVSIVDDKINIDVVGKNKWVGYRATGTYNNITVIGNGVEQTTAVAEVLVVAGGGGGGSGASGSNNGGGGGSGGVIHNSPYTVSLAQTYNIVVGAGGLADNNGEDSSFDTLIAIGGGHGGGLNPVVLSGAGGSGGGGGAGAPNTGAAGTNGQGFNGASGSTSYPYPGGGGGGASEAGNTDGAAYGGDGVAYSISGSSVTYGGGGGGGADANAGPGGDGGGGAGVVYSAGRSGYPGTANTGGGGGGGASQGASIPGGAGGSGIVIIRYLTGSMNATGGTVTIDGDYTVHTFTADGEFTVE